MATRTIQNVQTVEVLCLCRVSTSLSRLGKGKAVSRIMLSRTVMSCEVYGCGVAPSVCIPCDHIALAYVESSSLDHWQAVRVTEHEADQSMINQHERVTPPYARVMSPKYVLHEEFLDVVSDDYLGDFASLRTSGITCSEIFEWEMHCSRPLHYQAMMRRREVTAELWALYLIMRQPNIDRQWPSAAFSGVAFFLEQPVGGLSNHRKTGPTRGLLLGKIYEK